MIFAEQLATIGHQLLTWGEKTGLAHKGLGRKPEGLGQFWSIFDHFWSKMGNFGHFWGQFWLFLINFKWVKNDQKMVIFDPKSLRLFGDFSKMVWAGRYLLSKGRNWLPEEAIGLRQKALKRAFWRGMDTQADFFGVDSADRWPSGARQIGTVVSWKARQFG